MIALAVLALASADAAPVAEPEPPAAAVDNAGGTAEVLADFQQEQGKRGPLEGRWRVTAQDGTPLYLIELADPGGHPDPRSARPEAPRLEGAWLDLGRTEALDGAGYLAAAKSTPRGLVLMFYEGRGRAGARTVHLRLTEDGWRGDLRSRRRRTFVTMNRDALIAALP
ncbi:MAG TPA: hypothetical protein VKT30_19525 [Caulobacteraceae bacterium]|nr:hypothetical protein [Caulobacteraceae bacterium]